MAATEAKDTRRRVKLYVLNEKRVWDDRGTGHVSCTVNEKLGGTTLVVQSETDGTGLLESKIQMDTAYQKQQETLIVWSEGENYDLALSFQEKGGCDDIWEKICQVQGKDPSVEVTQEVGYEGESDSESGEPAETGTTASSTAGLPLPPCEISRLAEINELFNSCLCTPFRREHLAVAIETDGYIKKLVEIFHICEDLENRESLSILYQIFKSIFMLNKNSIYEILFSEDLIEDVVGVLEYDPISPVKKNHREYLWKTAKFKEVIPITSGDLRAKIHQTFRVQYIQDMILPTPSIFEENMLSTLTSFIFFNKVEIVSLIQDDDTFLTTLFTQLSDAKTERDRRRELMQFLREFCSFSQTQQPQNREQFYRTLSSHGILSVIEVCIQADDEQTRLSTIEIFSNVVDYNPSLVRDYMIQQGPARSDDKSLFLNIIIDQMFADKDPELGGAVQLLGVLRVLLDPENMMTALTNKAEKTEFLAFFYKRCMYNLCQPLFANTVEVDSHPAKDDYRTAHMLSLILEILSFCIEHHAYHVRNYVLNKDILRRVLVLLKSKHSFLQLGALRFLRRIIQLKDEFFNRYIVRQKLFGPVVECFFANGHKYNLLNSALLELFEFIRLEDIKTLCLYIVETYMDQFKEVDYVQTFRALKLRYEQQLDRINNKTPVFSDGFRSPAATCLQPTTQRVRRDQREMDEDEEAWFNEEDDEEWDDSQSPVTVTTHRPPGSSSSPSSNQSLNGSPSRSSPPLSPSRGNSGVGSPSSSSPQQQRIQISTASIVLSQSTQNKENVDASRLSPGFTRSVISCGSPNSRSSPVLMVSSAPLSPGCVSPRSTSPSVSPSDSVALLLNKGSLVDYDLDDESDEETQESSASAENKSPPCQLPVVTDLPDSGETSGSCAVVDSTSSTSDKATFDDQEDVVPSLPDDRMSAVSSSDCPMIPDIFTTSPRQENSGAAPLNNGDPRDDRLMFNDLLSDLSDHKSLNGAADSGCHSVGNGPSAYAMDNSSEVSPPTSPLGGNNEAEPSAACMSERMEAESDFCLPTNTELSLNAASEPDKSAIPSTVASVDADSSVADTPQVKRQRLSPPEGLPVPLSH